MEGPGYSFGLTCPYNYLQDGESWVVLHVPTGERTAVFEAEGFDLCLAEHKAMQKCIELNGLDQSPGQEVLLAIDLMS